jgi:hypothetical protein
MYISSFSWTSTLSLSPTPSPAVSTASTLFSDILRVLSVRLKPCLVMSPARTRAEKGEKCEVGLQANFEMPK